MKIHELKIKNKYWAEVYEGAKMFELRKNDRDFQVGDIIQFELVDADIDISEFKYRITYILKDVPEYGLDKDYCILGIAQIITVQEGANQTIIDIDDSCKVIRPADVPYDKHMAVVRENEELKETIVNLVKKLNECGFFG